MVCATVHVMERRVASTCNDLAASNCRNGATPINKVKKRQRRACTRIATRREGDNYLVISRVLLLSSRILVINLHGKARYVRGVSFLSFLLLFFFYFV